MIRWRVLSARLEQCSVWIWKLSRELLLERRVYYLFSTFLCQDRLTFLGHNLSNPETMCHNVSVSKQKSAKYRRVFVFLCHPVPTLLLWLFLTQPHLMITIRLRADRALCDGEQSYESRKCVNCHERVWPHVTNLAWHGAMWGDKVTGADPCRAGLRLSGGRSPGHCLKRSRPQTGTSGA